MLLGNAPGWSIEIVSSSNRKMEHYIKLFKYNETLILPQLKFTTTTINFLNFCLYYADPR